MNAIDINITQMMVGKQWVKRWGMYCRCTDEQARQAYRWRK